MISTILFILLVISVGALLFYKAQGFALKVGFAAIAVVMLIACGSLLSNIATPQGFSLDGFLFTSDFIDGGVAGGGLTLAGFSADGVVRFAGLSNFFALIVCVVGLVAAIYSLDYVKHTQGNKAVFVSLFAGFLLSMLLVIYSQDVFTFMVMWEVMTVISALLLKFNDTPQSNKIVMIYLGIAQVGAFCITIALLIIGSNIGSFNFADWHNAGLSPFYGGFVLICLLIGFGSKAGLFPFHVWLPGAYDNAPSNVSAFLSGALFKVTIFCFIKFALVVAVPVWFALSIVALGAIGALWGILHAVTQREFKRLVAYSSIENAGLIFLALGGALYGAATDNGVIFALGVIGALFHSLNHAVFKSLLFLACGAIQVATGEKTFEKVGGLMHQMPKTAIFVLVGCVAVCAAPPLNAFFGEWFIYRTLFGGAMADAASAGGVATRAVFVAGLIALAIVGALVVFAFIRFYGFLFAGAQKNHAANEKFPFILVALGVLAFLCVALGVCGNCIAAGLLQIAHDIAPNSNLRGLTDAGQLNFALLLVALLFLCVLPFSWFIALRSNAAKPRRTQPWANGFKYDPARLAGNSFSFIGDLRRVIGRLTFFKTTQSQENYFAPMSYEADNDDPIWRKFYEPVVRLNAYLGDKIGIMQNGKSSFYVGYILVYLVALLAVATQILGA